MSFFHLPPPRPTMGDLVLSRLAEIKKALLELDVRFSNQFIAIRQQYEKGVTHMSTKLDDAVAKIATIFQQGMTDLGTSIDTEIAAATTAVQAAIDDRDSDAAVAALETFGTNMTSAFASVKGKLDAETGVLIPPTPVPVPDPTPVPEPDPTPAPTDGGGPVTTS